MSVAEAVYQETCKFCEALVNGFKEDNSNAKRSPVISK